MRRLLFRGLELGVPVGVAAGLLLVALGSSLSQLAGLGAGTLVTLALFVVAIALGETARLTVLAGRLTAPMSSAAALALGLSNIAPDGDAAVGADVVVVTIGLGMLVGNGLLEATRRPVHWSGLAARFLGAAVVPFLYRSVRFDGATLLERSADWDSQRWLVAVVMLCVGSVAMLVDLTLQAIVRAGREHGPVLRSIVDEIRSTIGLATALVTSGTLIALAAYALGVVALPLFLFPLVLTYFAVQRYASIRQTYRQTIGALSSLTDRTSYTVPRHAQRVAEISMAVGRDLGMSQRELTDLEYAALLHDLGQVALREPIPQGATVMAAPADQQRIAHDGAEIVRSTGVLDNVATIMEAQITPYRQVREFGQDLPMASRIIKVANAYDDLSGPEGLHADRAMERIHLGLGYEYDPRVVDSLTRYLDRRGRSTAPSA
ncbi:metal-dependent phosphohydrolase [Pedococcus aerophilus]|uniref:Metal-dependent phosphohydrolase n=1 Tax=Pedococcus aerophilus TaxID=436356 RepID=A0ABP6H029_9MICO